VEKGDFLILEDSSLRGHIGRFFKRAKQFVRELITAGSMALLGPAPLSGQDLEETEKQVQVQEQYFDKFEQEVRAFPPKVRPEPKPLPQDLLAPEPILVQPPNMTPGQFVARVGSYGNAPFGAAQEVLRVHRFYNRDVDQERRVHNGTDNPCKDCIAELKKNWQPIMTLRRIGDSECKENCHCSFRFRLGDDGQEYELGEQMLVPLKHPSAEIIPDDRGQYPVAELPPT
jgi:hypothetical protein